MLPITFSPLQSKTKTLFICFVLIYSVNVSAQHHTQYCIVRPEDIELKLTKETQPSGIRVCEWNLMWTDYSTEVAVLKQSAVDSLWAQFCVFLTKCKHLKTLRINIAKANLNLSLLNVAKLKELESLRIHCSLSTISLLEGFTSLGNFKNLKELSIDTGYDEGTSVIPIPQWVYKLKRLERLGVDGVQDVPDNITLLRHLNYLFLGHVKFDSLPVVIYKLKRLKELNVYGSHKFSYLDDSALCRMKKLKRFQGTGSVFNNEPLLIRIHTRRPDIWLDYLYDPNLE